MGDYVWVKHFKSQYELLPFAASCNLIAKMHNTSKFWSIKFMDANFFYYSICNKFIQRQPRAYVRTLFSLKTLLVKKYCLDVYQISQSVP